LSVAVGRDPAAAYNDLFSVMFQGDADPRALFLRELVHMLRYFYFSNREY